MALRAGPDGKVRYAVVAGGWISQAAFMPAVAGTGNSALAAIVTGDPRKGEALSERYGIPAYGYADYAAVLARDDVDAVYIATPNWQHREFAVPALEAGVHVMLEKPMATSEEDCRAIMAAAEASGAKLVIAYRLHFEPANLDAIRLVRTGEIGEPRLFTSTFSQHLSPRNHRATNGFWAGPVADMGTYPINAARNLFSAEPIEVAAIGVRSGELPGDFHDSVAVTLRFPAERVAQFTVGYGTNTTDGYRIVGTKGDVEVTPAFGFGLGRGLGHRLTVGKETRERTFAETDQFGGEIEAFSAAILQGAEAEPSGEEGLCDVRVVCAVERALAAGQAQMLAPFTRARRPDPARSVVLPPSKPPELVDAAAPGEG